jgi:hypothetical protein
MLRAAEYFPFPGPSGYITLHEGTEVAFGGDGFTAMSNPLPASTTSCDNCGASVTEHGCLLVYFSTVEGPQCWDICLRCARTLPIRWSTWSTTQSTDVRKILRKMQETTHEAQRNEEYYGFTVAVSEVLFYMDMPTEELIAYRKDFDIAKRALVTIPGTLRGAMCKLLSDLKTSSHRLMLFADTERQNRQEIMRRTFADESFVEFTKRRRQKRDKRVKWDKRHVEIQDRMK